MAAPPPPPMKSRGLKLGKCGCWSNQILGFRREQRLKICSEVTVNRRRRNRKTTRSERVILETVLEREREIRTRIFYNAFPHGPCGFCLPTAVRLGTFFFNNFFL